MVKLHEAKEALFDYTDKKIENQFESIKLCTSYLINWSTVLN